MSDPVASEPVHPNASTARRSTTRTARRGALTAMMLGMTLLGGATLAGCQAANGSAPSASGGHAPSAATVAQVPLAVPVELREVLDSSPCTPQTPSPTTTSLTSTSSVTGTSMAGAVLAQPVSVAPTILHDVDGVDCYQVSPPLMELQQLNSINVVSQPPASQWVITMTMTRADAQSFAVLTTQHSREQFAFVVRGTVLSTLTIDTPITDGTVQLDGNFTQDDANRLVRQITG